VARVVDVLDDLFGLPMASGAVMMFLYANEVK
jgi:hypothetical protein